MGGLRQLADPQNCECHDEAYSSSSCANHSGPFNALARNARQGAKPDQLAKTIEAEVIPRLMMVHQEPRLGSGAVRSFDYSFSSSDIAEFAQIVVTKNLEAASEYVDVWLARGVPLEALFLKIFAPTARMLGEYWEADLCDFTEVAIGLCRLQQLLRNYSARAEHEIRPCSTGPRVVIAAATGENHTFGLYMVEEFFRRAGWEVWGGPTVRPRDILDLVRREWFALVGLSASCERSLDQLATDIRAIRAASRNRELHIMVGGRLFNDRPELVAQVGADATAPDGRMAVIEAGKLLGLSWMKLET